MRIFICYTIILLLILFFYLKTIHYKRNQFAKVTLKENKQKICFGISAFLIDFVNHNIHTIHYESIKAKLDKIYIKKTSDEEAYLYLVSKVSLSILIFFMITIIGYVNCIEILCTEQKQITYIERPDYGEGERTYNLVMHYDNNKQEKVEITISERKLTETEVMELFENSYETLVQEFLGKNNGVDNITEDVVLINELSNGIAIQWNLGESGVIDYSGGIIWDKIAETKELEIEATMSFDEYEKSYGIPIVLNKQLWKEESGLKNELDIMLENVSETEKQITLPQEIQEKEVTFYQEKEKGSFGYIFFAGIMAILIYFVKENETNQKLEKRKRELELDYAPIVSKLTILQGAGMSLLAAWDKIISDYENNICLNQNTAKRKFAYEEMKYARKRMKTGCLETASYLEFGRRCGIHSYIKFANLLEQNIKKGTKGLKDILNAEAREALEERKALARKKGDEAGTKLLLPMGIMLIISIIMIIVPAFLTIEL